jgi:hypothetical protein
MSKACGYAYLTFLALIPAAILALPSKSLALDACSEFLKVDAQAARMNLFTCTLQGHTDFQNDDQDPQMDTTGPSDSLSSSSSMICAGLYKLGKAPQIYAALWNSKLKIRASTTSDSEFGIAGMNDNANIFIPRFEFQIQPFQVPLRSTRNSALHLSGTFRVTQLSFLFRQERVLEESGLDCVAVNFR